ncbi:MAG: metallophosphatase [Bacteroides sp.]|nr:metallophosphatase [Bacteroides sp.]
MKINRYTLFTSLLLTLLPAVLPAQELISLRILHTNDTHNRIEPIPAGGRNAGKAGFVRRAASIAVEREEHHGLLLFDSGDFSQGTPYYNLFKGEVEVQLMNVMGYDACAVGNHKFDFGLENMARLFRMAGFPILCANYDFTGTVVEGLTQPYEIFERQGVRIGVLGISPRMEGLVAASNFEGVGYLDPVEKANEIAALLKNQNDCDVVICLSHLGMLPSAFNPECDEYLVRHTRNIDLILGGHSHTYMEGPEPYLNANGRTIYISQIGKEGVYVGTVDLKLEKR